MSLLLESISTLAGAQTLSLDGQASWWFTLVPGTSRNASTGLRYIPELNLEHELDTNLSMEAILAVNTFATGSFARGQHPSYDGQFKLYRGWLRLGSHELEVRIGLQKIVFGTATLLRPLMWFDRIDPRDPLQLTDGVYGALARYYFINNVNIWCWGLYGNEDPKGWEVAPTASKDVEFGGRVQIPLWTGEAGFSYHHRNADYSGLVTPSSAVSPIPEDRFALDGKWDVGIGVWFEGVFIHRRTDVPDAEYQRLFTIGGDYTFDVGDGLTALFEYMRSDAPREPLSTGDGMSLSALSLTYPMGLLDRLSFIVYRDWTHRQWYRFLSWQRTYDNWIFYVMGFSNPEEIRLYSAQAGTTAFAGTGIQLMVVFNH